MEAVNLGFLNFESGGCECNFSTFKFWQWRMRIYFRFLNVEDLNISSSILYVQRWFFVRRMRETEKEFFRFSIVRNESKFFDLILERWKNLGFSIFKFWEWRMWIYVFRFYVFIESFRSSNVRGRRVLSIFNC